MSKPSFAKNVLISEPILLSLTSCLKHQLRSLLMTRMVVYLLLCTISLSSFKFLSMRDKLICPDFFDLFMRFIKMSSIFTFGKLHWTWFGFQHEITDIHTCSNDEVVERFWTRPIAETAVQYCFSLISKFTAETYDSSSTLVFQFE